MRLELTHGPLDARRLQAIAGLYGEFNRKYRDADFCRRLFDENPCGAALHAFALDGGGEIVGHYAVVPLDVVRDGRRRRAGKGEAFVVRADRRMETISVDGGAPIAIGLAMPLQLYRHALEQGLELVHMIAGPEVGLIHRLTGCREVAVRQPRAGLALRPFAPPPPGRSAWRRAAQTALATGQACASALARAATFPGLGATRCVSGAGLDAAWLARIVADLPAGDGWTLAVDAPLLAWLARTGGLELVALDDGSDDYALVCGRAGEGRVMEVVLWRQRSAGLRPALRLLAAVVRRAGELDDLRVEVPLTAAARDGERAGLRAAARLFCFQEREQAWGMYVRSADRYYLDPGHLRFTPFFYATF